MTKTPPRPSEQIGSSRRLAVLVACLAVTVAAYVGSGGWRTSLLHESARHRDTIRDVERLRQAEESRRAYIAAVQRDLERKPQDAELRLELAQLRWREEGPAAAVAVLGAAPSETADPRLARMAAHCWRLLSREDRALEELGRAIRRWPGNGDLRADRALLYVLLAWHQDARKELRQAEKLGSQESYLGGAALARAEGDLRRARSLLEAAQSRHPDDVEIVRQLAALAQDGGKSLQAVQWLSEIPAAERLADDFLAESIAWMQLGDSTRALAFAERALAEAPGHPRAALVRARCLKRLGRLAEGRQALEELHRRIPGYSAAAYELAQQYRGEGRPDLARPLLLQHRRDQEQRAALKRAAAELMRRPEDARAHLRVGQLCLDRGYLGRAVVEFRRAGELNPALPEVSGLLQRARKSAERDASYPFTSEPDAP